MNLTRDRVQSIGWAFVLTICVGLTAALMLRVNAIKGNVHETEKKIVSLKHEIRFLETEFHTRANQQQLRVLNDLEFGYGAPRAEQYIEGERQLAALGMPRAPGAPKPIRMARAAPVKQGNSLLAMVSPITGGLADEPQSPARATAPRRPVGQAAALAPLEKSAPPPADDLLGNLIDASDLGDRLTRIELPAEGQ